MRGKLLGQSTKVRHRLIEGMAAFLIFGKTHRLKAMVKNAASKNAGFTPNWGKTHLRKRIFPSISRKTRDIEKKSQTKVVERKILHKDDLSLFYF